MGILDRIFSNRSRQTPSGSDPGGLIRTANSQDHQRAEQAILALGQMPYSAEAFECLDGLTKSGRHSASAIAALGMMGHPRAAKRLVDIVDAGAFYPAFADLDKAVRALGHPRNDSAVPALLNLALAHREYICVEAAVKALGGIGTAEAQSALEEFRRRPARVMMVTYAGFETPEPISTSALGQVPTESEQERARSKLASQDVFWFGSHSAAIAALDQCLTTPETAPLWRLRRFLAGDFRVFHSSIEQCLRGDLCRAAVQYSAEASRRAYAARKQEMEQRLATSDTMRLEAHLLNQLEVDSGGEALSLYRLLPRKQQIAKLAGVKREWQREDEVEEYVAELQRRKLEKARQELPAQVVAFVTQHLDSGPMTQEVKRLAGCGDEAVPFILPLLNDRRWQARMRAVEMLAQLKGKLVRSTLETFLATEQDAEIRREAENALKAQPH